MANAVMLRRSLVGAHIPPSAFAFVMATGIVSAAFDDVGHHGLAMWLLLLATGALALLVVGLFVQIPRDRCRLVR
ncbi:hypothetical protein [Arthrobacter sp. GMC3]|uniref:hypothetical protein n=1 Tax=Arthrobacter sp. GMC3 TaxID=2058894 RepID=UPI001CA58453|nr:hypothetical protein [Arthrobacter sp. GMC3]